ncbi:hypothetical protein D9M69_633170 [compost metagenome]
MRRIRLLQAALEFTVFLTQRFQLLQDLSSGYFAQGLLELLNIEQLLLEFIRLAPGPLTLLF